MSEANGFQIYELDGWQDVHADMTNSVDAIGTAMIASIQQGTRIVAAYDAALRQCDKISTKYKDYGAWDGEVVRTYAWLLRKRLKNAQYELPRNYCE
jgi:hypothetical protein